MSEVFVGTVDVVERRQPDEIIMMAAPGGGAAGGLETVGTNFLIIRLNANTGEIVCGGDRHAGTLRPLNGLLQETATLDAQFSNLRLGGNGSDGDILLFAGAGNRNDTAAATIHLDGPNPARRHMIGRTSGYLTSAACLALLLALAPLAAQTTAIRAGRLLDPERGVVTQNQIILVENGRFTQIGAAGSLAIPAGAEVIDLSSLTVMPGLVDAHNHLALTYKDEPESNVYYYTYVADPTPLRAIQAVSNGMQMLSSGFTIIRDMGNNGNYADAALRVAIEQGWIPGPTIINSGIIIGGMGGQFWPTPEMAKDHNIVYPEYLDADTPDEIVKAVRQNALFGATVIKICVDCKPWGYSVDEIKLFISEAAKIGFKVEGHVQTRDGARRAIEAGIWSIAHDNGLDEEMHRGMAAKRIFRAGTETPISLTGHTNPDRYARTVAKLKNAYDLKVPLTFSTDADYYVPGKTRGEVAIEFIET
ncbi:MAG TPA: amidohydrolase family protein, partial [Gemmatimonadaceae bacterium]|nr:amidohydrolase family protein [Gemmatimonadaceae bacterium]